MSTKVLVRIIISAIIIVLLAIIYIYQTDALQNNNDDLSDTPVVQGNEETEPTESPISTDRLKAMTDSISDLEDAVADQQKLIDDLTEANEASATKEAEILGQKILAIAHAKGSAFSTTSTSYSDMNMFVNIICSAQCTLWIDFYTISKNDSANNENAYGIFLNGQDQSIQGIATMPVANGAVPISINSALPVNSGTYTVEIRAKTSGGTLQTDTSFLQVMAVER